MWCPKIGSHIAEKRKIERRNVEVFIVGEI